MSLGSGLVEAWELVLRMVLGDGERCLDLVYQLAEACNFLLIAGNKTLASLVLSFRRFWLCLIVLGTGTMLDGRVFPLLPARPSNGVEALGNSHQGISGGLPGKWVSVVWWF